MCVAFGPLTSCFSVERDFTKYWNFRQLKNSLSCFDKLTGLGKHAVDLYPFKDNRKFNALFLIYIDVFKLYKHFHPAKCIFKGFNGAINYISGSLTIF